MWFGQSDLRPWVNEREREDFIKHPRTITTTDKGGTSLELLKQINLSCLEISLKDVHSTS